MADLLVQLVFVDIPNGMFEDAKDAGEHLWQTMTSLSRDADLSHLKLCCEEQSLSKEEKKMVLENVMMAALKMQDGSTKDYDMNNNCDINMNQVSLKHGKPPSSPKGHKHVPSTK